MGVTASLSVSVIGSGTSLTPFVRAAVEALSKERVKHEVGPMSTALEAASFDELLRGVKAAHDAVVAEGAKRVVLTLHVDHRLDKESSLERKVAAVKR